MPTKILVADDSATMRRVLEMTFAGEDASVVTVDSGEAALERLSEVGPDIVFADASMPGVDGYELARRIKAQPATAKVAVIVMASQHTPYDDSKGRASGVDDHISKPFDTQAVIDRVSQVLARPRAMPAGASADAGRISAPGPVPPARPAPPAVAAAAAPAAVPAPPARVAQGTRLGLGAPVPLQPSPPKPAVAPPVVPPAVAAPPAPTAAAPARPNATVPLAPVAQPAPKPAAPAPNLVAAAAPAAKPQVAPAAVAAASADLAGKLGQLGLTREQVEGVLALSREVIEQVVWEVVPELAEQVIREEIKRLTAE